jgi:hypothetical protein
MRHACRTLALAAAFLAVAATLARAQEPPPPIPRVVVDLHATVPSFPSDPALAASRGLSLAELPGLGFGADFAVHVYPARWRAVTFGIGGRVTTARAHQGQDASSGLRPVTERFTDVAPEISLNFGTGAGWSYLSGGISAARWSVATDGSGAAALPPDEQRLKTIDYGGGARWFARPHLAFSFDVRVYAINPSTPAEGLPPGPRTTLIVIGAGVSLK